MTSIEERLARDIAAVTGGITMTGADLQQARENLDDRIDERRRRRHRGLAGLGVGIVAAASVVAAVQLTNDDDPKASPAGDPGPSLSALDRAHLEGKAATIEAIAGVWRLDNGVMAYQFEADGTMRFTSDGRLFDSSSSTAAFEIDGDRITVTTASSPTGRCVGSQVELWASVATPGSVRLVVPAADPVCSPFESGQQSLERLSPRNTYGAEFWTEFEGSDFRSLEDATVLQGLFFDRAGDVLELDQGMTGPGRSAGGRYHVVDQSNRVVDTGTWQARDGSLTLTSSAESEVCEEGDILALADVEYFTEGTFGFRGRITRNDCSGSPTPSLWLRVPSTLG